MRGPCKCRVGPVTHWHGRGLPASSDLLGAARMCFYDHHFVLISFTGAHIILIILRHEGRPSSRGRPQATGRDSVSNPQRLAKHRCSTINVGQKMKSSRPFPKACKSPGKRDTRLQFVLGRGTAQNETFTGGRNLGVSHRSAPPTGGGTSEGSGRPAPRRQQHLPVRRAPRGPAPASAPGDVTPLQMRARHTKLGAQTGNSLSKQVTAN